MWQPADSPPKPKDTFMSTDTLSASESEQARSHLWSLIKDIRFAMFTTRHANGHLHSRPMTTQNTKIEEDSSMWFFMSRGGDPVEDLLIDPMVNLVYADPGEDIYVSISGTASVVQDAAKTRELWSKMAESWFPGGTSDADLALVQVKIVHANYWDVKESKLVQLMHIAQAVVTGERPATLSKQAEIRLG